MATINIIQQSTPQQIRLIQEDISDQLGSSNVVFMVGQNFISGTLQVFLNGLSMRLDSDFNEIGTQSFRFINYDSSFIRTINSPSSTLAVKYFKYFEPSDPSPSSLSIFSDDSSDGEDDIVISDIEKYEDDISYQVLPGIVSFFASNSFELGTLEVFSDGKQLTKDIDFSENGNDALIIHDKSLIKNNNLLLKYIIA
jgi:hypothetical protein